MRNFNEVKKHLDTLNSTQEKIAYLVECKNRNQQTNTDLFIEGYVSPFDRKCQLEIEILKERLALESVETTQQPKPKQSKPNKSLLFEGKELNLLERFKIANRVLDIDKKIRTLNIQDLEKYQLLAYILGCDKDNARNLMNGTYKTKDRDLTDFFNDLGLNQ